MEKTANITASSFAPATPRPAKPAVPTSSFDEKVTIETAEQLLRGSGQYSRWQSLRQKNDNSALLVAGTLLERHRLLMADKNGEQVNWKAFDDLTRSLGLSGIHLYDSGFFQKQSPVLFSAPVASNKISTTASTPLLVSVPPPIVSIPQASSAKSLLNEENSLIFNMTCAPIALQETAFGYGDDEITLLPLGELSAALDLKIDVDAGRGTASGWFISEDRTFLLDINREKIRIGETDIPWQKDSVFAHDGEVYVDSRILSTWLPLDFDISRAELTVDVIPREKLPLQARMEREQRRLRLNSGGDMTLKYPVRKLEYDLFSTPVFDVSISGGVGQEGLESAELQSNYSLLGRSDFLYMNSHMFVAGSEDDPLDIARVRLERFDPNANMFGPIGARQVALGDIVPIDFPILNSLSPERGAFISNSDMVQRSDFDVTTFEGTVLPGWEVELYFNDNLINSTLVKADGRYLFEDVPLFYGNNNFKVLAYGPQGQQKILKETTIPVGLEMLPKGESQFDVSLSQRKKTVLGIDEGDNSKSENTARLRGKYKIGLGESISLTSGIASVEFDDERHNYLQTGLSGKTSFLYGQIDGLYDTASGAGLSLFAQTALGPFSIKARHEWFSDMVLENRPNDTLESQTEVELSGAIPGTAISPRLSYMFSGRNTKFSDASRTKFNNRLSTIIGGVHLHNNASWFLENDKNEQSERVVKSRFNASGHVGPMRLSGVMDYSLGEENKISRYGISGHWPVSNNLSTGFDLIQEDDYYDRTTASAKLNWDSGPMTVSPRLSYDSDGHYGAFLSLSFSLGPAPAHGGLEMSSEKRANSGTATARVYHDANNNKVYDIGDALLSDVKIKAPQAGATATTEEDGRAAIAGLSAYQPTDIEIDLDTLEDPFWLPSMEGVAIRPRPGHVDHLEMPVVSTGEVDGTLYSVSSDGAKTILANVHLELLDTDGNVVQTTRSEYDGFYLFEKVFPGNYILRVSPKDSNSKLAGGSQQRVSIGNDGTIVSGMDMLFEGAEDPGRADIVSHTVPKQTEQMDSIEEPLPLMAMEASSIAALEEPPLVPTRQQAEVVEDLVDHREQSNETIKVVESVTAPLIAEQVAPAPSTPGEPVAETEKGKNYANIIADYEVIPLPISTFTPFHPMGIENRQLAATEIYRNNKNSIGAGGRTGLKILG